MTDRPIIFSGAMVRALLAGRKTQTRRLASSPLARCVVGDRLYVREAWRVPSNWDDVSPATMVANCRAAGWNHPWAPIAWEADGTRENWGEGWRAHGPGRLRPSMHLPKSYSRLTLTVTDVRQQPLCSLTEADAAAEGPVQIAAGWHVPGTDLPPMPTAAGAFARLWSSLHQADGECWTDDPTIVALTFTVTAGNIDRIAA